MIAEHIETLKGIDPDFTEESGARDGSAAWTPSISYTCMRITRV